MRRAKKCSSPMPRQWRIYA